MGQLARSYLSSAQTNTNPVSPPQTQLPTAQVYSPQQHINLLYPPVQTPSTRLRQSATIQRHTSLRRWNRTTPVHRVELALLGDMVPLAHQRGVRAELGVRVGEAGSTVPLLLSIKLVCYVLERDRRNSIDYGIFRDLYDHQLSVNVTVTNQFCPCYS